MDSDLTCAAWRHLFSEVLRFFISSLAWITQSFHIFHTGAAFVLTTLGKPHTTTRSSTNLDTYLITAFFTGGFESYQESQRGFEDIAISGRVESGELKCCTSLSSPQKQINHIMRRT